MVVALSPIPKFQFFDNNGNPLVGGKLYTYQSNTLTPLATYTDYTGVTPNSNPVILNSRGEANVWLPQSSTYKFKLTDANDVEIWTVNGISNSTELDAFIALLASSAGSSLVGFTQGGTGSVTRTVQSKLRDFVNVKDFGAVGDGVTDDRPAFIAAMTFLGSSGGTVYVPPGTYVGSRASNGYCFYFPASKINLIGAGRGATTLTMYNSQETFTSVLGAENKNQIGIYNLTIDGNSSNQSAGFEHQHGIFLQGSTGSIFSNVEVKNTRGDGYYWYGNCTNCSASNLWMTNSYRVGFHTQTLTNCSIVNYHYNSNQGSCGIKSELDDDGPEVNGLTISNSTFKTTATGGPSGIIFGGWSASTKCRNIEITNCQFSGNLTEMINYIYTENLTISNCIGNGTVRGITAASYNQIYGLTGNKNITIQNNQILNTTSSSSDGFGINIANCTGYIIQGNIHTSATAIRGISNQLSTDGKVANNITRISGTSALGIALNDCGVVDISSNSVNVGSSGTAFYSENSYSPSKRIRIRGLTVEESCNTVYDIRFATRGSILIDNNTDAPLYTTLVDGSFYLSTPIAGLWGKSVQIANLGVASGGYIGWVCTTAGGANAGVRANSTSYAFSSSTQSGDWVQWSTGNTVWECTVSGTTAGSAPSIVGKVVGDTVVDGTVTWTMRSTTPAVFKTYGVVS